MKKTILYCALATVLMLGHTEADTLFDIDNVALNTPDALSKALEEAGGSSGGDATVVEMTGPDGKMQRVFEFPTVESFVMLPCKSNSKMYKTTVSIDVEELPFTKAGGTLFGVMFGPNDVVLALTCGKWSPVMAPSFGAGQSTLVEASEIHETQFPSKGMWQKMAIGREGNRWSLELWTEDAAGSSPALSKSDDYFNEDRQAFSRKPPLWIRVGTFRGRATNPTFSEE